MAWCRLEPLGKAIYVGEGLPLKEVLFSYGVEFPCGGRGKCKACRVRVTGGVLPPVQDELRILSSEEIAQGWRLACRSVVHGDCVLEIAQWESPILTDNRPFHFTPREGFGVAIDLGTTTVVAQLIDLATAQVHAVNTALNGQAVHGSDIMSRVQHALTPSGAKELRDIIRCGLGAMIAGFDVPAIADVVIVGNTVMHHLFCGIDVEPLSHYPFEPVRDGLECLQPEELGWPRGGRVRFLPCLGGFVGSDILAGILATSLHESAEPVALMDLGTNGEVVVGTRDRLYCASTAAGPAFEGGRIGAGMRAATGAISEVSIRDGALISTVIGGGTARGVCGSGLVDAVACGLEAGLVQPNGRLKNGPLTLAPGIALQQSDIRELQLAKGAIAAGLDLLAARCGLTPDALSRIYLAGAFGNYVNRASARRIGLIDFPEEQVEPAGNTSLLGAKMALFRPDDDFEWLRRRVQHVMLNADPEFQDAYVSRMIFPSNGL